MTTHTGKIEYKFKFRKALPSRPQTRVRTLDLELALCRSVPLVRSCSSTGLLQEECDRSYAMPQISITVQSILPRLKRKAEGRGLSCTESPLCARLHAGLCANTHPIGLGGPQMSYQGPTLALCSSSAKVSVLSVPWGANHEGLGPLTLS